MIFLHQVGGVSGCLRSVPAAESATDLFAGTSYSDNYLIRDYE